MTSTKQNLLTWPVIIAALGYFVDIYDLLLFAIVRIQSLTDLGLNPDVVGTRILNFQMFGMLVGGILWGVLGDKRGRLSTLFGSIILYSAANFACGLLPYVPKEHVADMYSWLRFFAGVGLAGELGAGITLVSESLPTKYRALGTSIVAGFGILGAVVAELTVNLAGSWSVAYLVGGLLGFALLLLRISVHESGIFESAKKQKHLKHGDFTMMFTNKSRFIRYVSCVAIGLPIWYCVGVLVFLANQFGAAKGIAGVEPGKAIFWCYLLAAMGDLSSGPISYYLKSRRQAVFYFLLFTFVGVLLLLFSDYDSAGMYYFYCGWIGLGTGFWAMFVTLSAEQFGTNLRSTAATTIPNVVRGLVPLLLLSYEFLKTYFDPILAVLLVGILVFSFALIALHGTSETHDRTLDFYEE